MIKINIQGKDYFLKQEGKETFSKICKSVLNEKKESWIEVQDSFKKVLINLNNVNFIEFETAKLEPIKVRNLGREKREEMLKNLNNKTKSK